MITLYDNAFSPFARKVRMVLDYKGLEYSTIDGLHATGQPALEEVNPRREVPVLMDGDVTVVNSAHIVQYLEEAYPEKRVLPADLARRVRARHWERISDSLVDAILLSVSLWSWARREDTAPNGMSEKAREDLGSVYTALERELAQSSRGFVCDELSIADIALFPHLRSARSFGAPIDPATHPRLGAWLQRMSEQPVAQADMQRLKAWLTHLDRAGYEVTRIFWRGDRIEWLLASGFHEWFLEEIRADRVLWPATRLG
jgi:glutathione S-transferase